MNIRYFTGICVARSGSNTRDGLYFCGSEAAFIKFLNSFYNSIEVKASDIEAAYSNGDFTTYTSKVHSLKSTSRIIGALELSDFALSLEEAGRSGDIEFIRDNHAKFIELFRSYIKKLSILDSKGDSQGDSKKDIPNEELQDAYNALSEVIPMQDYDAVEMILESLKEYRLPEADALIIEKLDKFLINMQWDDMLNIISEKNKRGY